MIWDGLVGPDQEVRTLYQLLVEDQRSTLPMIMKQTLRKLLHFLEMSL